LPNTSAIVFKNLSGAEVAAECDRRGLAVSAGSACHAGGEAPSPVAAAVGLPSAHRRGLVRVSLGPETTAAEAEQAASILIAAAQAVRARG
ncbi:MAG: aminotransferase class V-fold PLP-dependent enzyme, partial [Candidatus Polarisedimenticolia bacterium]